MPQSRSWLSNPHFHHTFLYHSMIEKPKDIITVEEEDRVLCQAPPLIPGLLVAL